MGKNRKLKKDVKSKFLVKEPWKRLLSLVDGREIAKVWRGYGTKIFLEVGSLDDSGRGEVTIAINDTWSLVKKNELIVSSNENNWKEIDATLARLQGQRILFATIGREGGLMILIGESTLRIQQSLNRDEMIIPWYIRYKSEGIFVRFQRNRICIKKWD